MVGKEKMGLGCICRALLTLLESKSCPTFLLYTQVPGAQPGRPGLCPQPSFRPPSKLLFYTAWPGTPTVTKLRPHYGTVEKRDLIFMLECQLLGPLPLHEACIGSQSHTAAAKRRMVSHCGEVAKKKYGKALTSTLNAGA